MLSFVVETSHINTSQRLICIQSTSLDGCVSKQHFLHESQSNHEKEYFCLMQ